jgi:hypothetical protein
VINNRGYGVTGLSNRRVYVHRLAFELTHGPIPAGSEVCHSCDNPPCLNVEHLFLGTHSENMLDAGRKGRLLGRPKVAVA